MAQADFNIENQSGASFRTDLNNQLLALGTNSSGATAPSTTFAFMWWGDTANDALKIRNAANNGWVTVGTLSATTFGLLSRAGGTMDEGANIATGTTTGTKIGTATTQKIGFYNATPTVQGTAIADLTVTATSGSLPTANGSVTIANAATPTVVELLEYCAELEAKLEALLARIRSTGLIAT
jgi:hypothetical protein